MICLLETFLTFAFVTALVDAPGPATAVPASAATSASAATASAGEGREWVNRLMIDSLLRRNPTSIPLERAWSRSLSYYRVPVKSKSTIRTQASGIPDLRHQAHGVGDTPVLGEEPSG